MKILEAALDNYELTAFESTVSALDNLPTMPAVIQRLLALTSSPDCSLDDVEELIAADQALVVKLMRLASSAAMSSRPVTSLRGALVRIGLRDLRKLVIAALMIDSDKPSALHTEVWGYSLRIASIAEAIAAKLNSHLVEDPFLCGLLHDFGIVALERVLGADYANIHEAPGSAAHLDAERERFSFDHCDMGAILAREWNLFPTLVSIMQLHHDPLAAREVVDEPTATAITVVALSRDCAFDVVSETTPELCESLGLTIDQTAEAAIAGMETFERLYAQLLA